MRRVQAKLLRKFAKSTKRDYDATKRWFKGLNRNQRAAAADGMRRTLPKPNQPAETA